MTIRLIHVSPELPPNVGGVADYTAILSRRLVEVSDGAIKPVLVHAGMKETNPIDVSFPVTDLSGQCSAAALAQAIEHLVDKADERVVVLLEYSGYGYAKRGAPWWLVRGLRRGCRNRGVSLISVFHELYASGPPWKSAFWMSFLQAHVARKLAQLSTGIATNRVSSEEWLQGVSEIGGLVKMQPVFSNVGEPEHVLSLSERESVAVVFGGTGKDALYDEHGDTLAFCLKELGISKLIDFGPPPATGNPIDDEAVHVDVRGVVDQGIVSDSLRQASMGVLCRNPQALTKSGSLAAYMAHGVPSVVALRHSANPSPILEDGHHYVSLGRLAEKEADWDEDAWAAIGQQGREWYTSNAHSRRAARTVLQLIKNP